MIVSPIARTAPTANFPTDQPTSQTHGQHLKRSLDVGGSTEDSFRDLPATPRLYCPSSASFTPALYPAVNAPVPSRKPSPSEAPATERACPFPMVNGWPSTFSSYFLFSCSEHILQLTQASIKMMPSSNARWHLWTFFGHLHTFSLAMHGIVNEHALPKCC
jgi:hypothetical protein